MKNISFKKILVFAGILLSILFFNCIANADIVKETTIKNLHPRMEQESIAYGEGVYAIAGVKYRDTERTRSDIYVRIYNKIEDYTNGSPLNGLSPLAENRISRMFNDTEEDRELLRELRWHYADRGIVIPDNFQITNRLVPALNHRPQIFYSTVTHTFLVVWIQRRLFTGSTYDVEQALCMVFNYNPSSGTISKWNEPKVLTKIDLIPSSTTAYPIVLDQRILNIDIDVPNNHDQAAVAITKTIKMRHFNGGSWDETIRVADLRIIPLYLLGYSYNLGQDFYRYDLHGEGIRNNTKLKNISSSIYRDPESGRVIIWVLVVTDFGYLRAFRVEEDFLNGIGEPYLRLIDYHDEPRYDRVPDEEVLDTDPPIVRVDSDTGYPIFVYRFDNRRDTRRNRTDWIDIRYYNTDTDRVYYITNLVAPISSRSNKLNPKLIISPYQRAFTYQGERILENGDGTTRTINCIYYRNISGDLTGPPFCDSWDRSYAISSIYTNAGNNKGLIFINSRRALSYWNGTDIVPGSEPGTLHWTFLSSGTR